MHEKTRLSQTMHLKQINKKSKTRCMIAIMHPKQTSCHPQKSGSVMKKLKIAPKHWNGTHIQPIFSYSKAFDVSTKKFALKF